MRLIDADAFKAGLLDTTGEFKKENGYILLMKMFCALVDAEPTIVGTGVVTRCKDCEHYEMGVCLKIYQDGNLHSEAWQPRKPEDFCSYGERKDGKTDA